MSFIIRMAMFTKDCGETVLRRVMGKSTTKLERSLKGISVTTRLTQEEICCILMEIVMMGCSKMD